MHESLDRDGCATLAQLLDADQRRELRNAYSDAGRFRSRVVMQRHNFGRGEYQYFADPLPPLVQELRERLYAHLAPAANRWAGLLGEAADFPPRHSQFRARCHAAGQARPTPLLLRYGPGDYNCLHQDLYGGVVFPLQVVFLLSEPGADFDGGELVLVEQRPRMQSRARVVPLQAGDAAVFAVRQRPARGVRGHYRAQLRHGVSEIRRGERLTLGIIFHDAA
ncbi:MAG TPA: 2OG-Fe(II) oxygenase [Candidatus Binatia bacterium]|nr:2OG-Fe(II) oxygenase [Candidatus Binatia bacterium]